MEEVKSALNSLEDDKALEADGFPTKFLKKMLGCSEKGCLCGSKGLSFKQSVMQKP